MLTPMQIRDKEFRSAGRNSYRADEVDTFFDEVASSYDQMFKENTELVKRVSLLAERLEQYKKDEDCIKSAVLTAQRAADKIVKEAAEKADIATREASDILAAAKSEASLIRQDTEQGVLSELADSIEAAKKEAQELIDKAKSEAKDIIIEAQAAAKDVQGAANRTITSETILYDMLKKEVSEFKTELMSKYKAHIELITQLPELAEKKAIALEKTDDIAGSVVSDESAPEASEAHDEDEKQSDDCGCCECTNLEFDTSEADIEFIDDKGQLEGVMSIDDFVANTTPVNTEEPLSGNTEDIVVETSIPFFTDDSSNELHFVDDEKNYEDADKSSDLNVGDFIESFEEGHADEDTPVRKKGFSVNVSKVSAGGDAESTDSSDFGVSTLADVLSKNDDNNEKSSEESGGAFFDSRTASGFKLKKYVQSTDSIGSEPLAGNTDNTDNAVSGSKNELKNKFSVIRMNDGADSATPKASDDDDYDDDDDDAAPSHRKLFRKKK